MKEIIAPTQRAIDIDNPMAFAQWGLGRLLPDWVGPDMNMPIVNLGPGNKHITEADEFEYPSWDAELDPLPYDDNTVGGVYATHFLEHIADVRGLLREVGRVLHPGCPFNILVPHAQSLMFLQDLDHKTPFVIDTWKVLLDQRFYDKDKDGFPFRIGANFTFAVAERNTALITQLIKTEM